VGAGFFIKLNLSAAVDLRPNLRHRLVLYPNNKRQTGKVIRFVFVCLFSTKVVVLLNLSRD